MPSASTPSMRCATTRRRTFSPSCPPGSTSCRETVGRPLVLIAESDLNDPVVITPRAEGGFGLDAQWDDDVHHALHALLTGERQAYYVDFGSLAVLAKVLTSAFLHDGTFSTFRGRTHGKPVDRRAITGYRFVACPAES